MNQITDTILMVRPARFGFNPQTAEDNQFQTNHPGLSTAQVSEQARREFDDLVEKLQQANIRVLVFEDTPEPLKTDAVFPNNWFSTHQDGTLYTYPMFSEIRRRERQLGVIEQLQSCFEISNWVHLEDGEHQGRFLESTGSMILDRVNRLAYACRSERTDEDLLNDFCRRQHYRPLLFDAFDESGMPVYHTNVMMALGETFCIICLDSIRQVEERQMVMEQLVATDKEVIPISLAQMHAFAGNMLQVRSRDGIRYLVMSERAYISLSPHQIDLINRHCQILYSPLPTIETYGGGSARCMMAEVFLPERQSTPAVEDQLLGT